MKLNFLNIKTPKEIQLEIAKNVRKRRKEATEKFSIAPIFYLISLKSLSLKSTNLNLSPTQTTFE